VSTRRGDKMRDYTPKVTKEELIHGHYYKGRCRNATEARWNEPENRFYHWRTKFGYRFIETICCPEDESIYDVFVTEEWIGPKGTEEIPFNTRK